MTIPKPTPPTVQLIPVQLRDTIPLPDECPKHPDGNTSEPCSTCKAIRLERTARRRQIRYFRV